MVYLRKKVNRISVRNYLHRFAFTRWHGQVYVSTRFTKFAQERVKRNLVCHAMFRSCLSCKNCPLGFDMYSWVQGQRITNNNMTGAVHSSYCGSAEYHQFRTLKSWNKHEVCVCKWLCVFSICRWGDVGDLQLPFRWVSTLARHKEQWQWQRKPRVCPSRHSLCDYWLNPLLHHGALLTLDTPSDRQSSLFLLLLFRSWYNSTVECGRHFLDNRHR